jgi:hypothetical protein
MTIKLPEMYEWMHRVSSDMQSDIADYALAAIESYKQQQGDASKATRPANSQEWKGMTGSCAFLLIERHADGWGDIELMMGEWLAANSPPAPAQQPLMVDMVPPATSRDRWMYEQGRLAERDPRSHPAQQPLSDEECDKLVAEVIDAVAKEKGLDHAMHLNADITTQSTLRRAIVRRAHGIGGEK